MGADLAGRHILVVEDEFLTADEIVWVFESLGARVIGPAPSLDQALACIEAADRLDAATLDVNLRGQMVFPVADVLRRRGVPFVFATGYDQKIIPERFRTVPRFEKPVDPARLARALAG